jgi:hypothetical protein
MTLPQMTEERYTAIFLEEGVDREWAQICYRREVKAGITLTEKFVRQAAQDWAKDDGF